MRGRYAILFAVFGLCFLWAVYAFSQESPAAAEKQEAPLVTETPAPVSLESPLEGQGPLVESELQWLWGEVVSVDAPGKKLTVKYLNYETDSEENMTIALDDKTVLENIQGLADLQPKDTLSIDYVMNTSGESIARNINLEKNTAVDEPAAGGLEEPVVPAQAQ